MLRFILLFPCFLMMLLSAPAFGATKSDIEALKIADQGQYPAAMRLANRSSNAYIRPLVRWLYLTHEKSSPAFGEITGFVEKHPNWPRMHILKSKAEEAIQHGFKPSNDRLIRWFDNFSPVSDDAKYAYIQALFSQKEKREEAVNTLRRYWQEGAFYTKQQKNILRRFRPLLREQDHSTRLDNLINSENYERARFGLRAAPTRYKLLGYARLQLAENKLGVDKAIAKVPDNLQKDARLIYERVRWRRRKDRDNAAVLFLNSYEGDIPNDLRGKWWHERHILARRFLERKDYIKAYKIAARHNQKEGFPLAQAEWLSGWLALNYLDKPAKAFKHFETLFNNVSTPISKARGAYWAGLASDENNYNKIAQQWYKVAAQYYGTFYGQLAAARLPSGEAPFKRAVKKPFNPPLTSQERKTFYNQNFVRIAKLLVQSGMSEHAQDFMYHIANKLDDKKDYALYIQLARQAEDWASLLRVGKKAMVKYLPIWEATYPIGPFPIGVRPHPSLTYGVIRQESAFYIDAQSGAGARGLMQLMPATAKGVAKRHGQRYSFARLTRDPAYNIYLGQAYLQEMLDRFDQATPLAVAAYNAGPNRVESWLKTYGDPRKKEIDWIDWMESIPVYETRNYVQRVLEAQHIYGIRMAP